jgi:hypothetical protein
VTSKEEEEFVGREGRGEMVFEEPTADYLG